MWDLWAESSMRPMAPPCWPIRTGPCSITIRGIGAESLEGDLIAALWERFNLVDRRDRKKLGRRFISLRYLKEGKEGSFGFRSPCPVIVQ